MTDLYRVLADLPLTIESCRFERRSLDVSTGFTRVTTLVTLAGAGESGQGEDVTYEVEEHDSYPAEIPVTGGWTVDGFSDELEQTELFARPPGQAWARDYRRWAFESAALDLALRQARTSLGEALGLKARPVRFVVSTRLDPRQWLAIDPSLKFKLDVESDWTRAEMEALAATGSVRVLDYKGYYTGTPVDLPSDPELYRIAAEAFPDAILEDPYWNDDTRAALAGHEERLAWDAPVHSAADLDALPVAPRHVNMKPSRFGTVRRFLECVEVCRQRGIDLYGGGQFELGPGRRQIQALASLFYPDAPNDVAPGAYNEPEPRPGLPRSPLEPPADGRGFASPDGGRPTT